MDGGLDARGVLAGHTGPAPALAADGDIERPVALSAQLGQRDVFADLDTAADVNAQLPQNVDLGINDVFLELKRRDAVAQHAAGTLVFLKYGGLVALHCQKIGAGQTRGAAADDGDLLRPRALQRRLDNVGHVAVRGVQVLLGNELLDGVDGHGLIHGAAGAGVLAPAVADAPADGGEGVLLFNKRQRVAVAALRGHFQIALHGNVRGAGRLAGGRAGVIAVDAVLVAVVDGPLVGAPLHGVGQLLLRVGDGAVLRAELLAQLDRARGAVLHTAPAGHAVLRLDTRHVGRAAHVRRVEQLACAQRIADVDVAVADGKNLVLAVDVRDLVHKAVVLGLLQDLHDLIVGHVMPLVGLDEVVGHIAHADAPVVGVVAAALAHGGAGHTAAARTGSILAVVFFQPVRDVLNVGGPVLGLDGFFHRDDVHTDACAARGHHGGDVLQRQKRHPLKEGCHLGVVGDLLFVHVEELCAAGHEHRQDVLLFAAGILPVVLQQTDDGHLLQKRLQLPGRLARGLDQLGQGHGLADLHF